MGRADGAGRRGHRGNKADLPAKNCAACGRTMTWRRAWARNWADVRYCSDRCRRLRRPAPGKPT